MFNNLLQNCSEPQNSCGGRLILWGMNFFHSGLSKWSFSFLPIENRKQNLLDIGCGGGRNVALLHSKAPLAMVFGIDYAKASVEKSISYNSKAVACGSVSIQNGNANALPYADSFFDVITAFETIYFWQPIEACFAEVIRTLKHGGRFMIVCEASNVATAQRWTSSIKGMTVYDVSTLQKMLLKAGFANIEIHTKGESIAIIATK